MGWFSSLFDPPAQYAQPDLVSGPTLDRVLVHVTWGSPENKAHVGETRGPELLDDEYHAWLTVPKPKDFNDVSRLTTLGHELFHALGAKHA